MKIAVIGGTQVAISGTAEEVKELLHKLRVVTVEQTGSVTKYVTQDKRIKLAK